MNLLLYIFCSDFPKPALLSIDGIGEARRLCTSLFRWEIGQQRGSYSSMERMSMLGQAVELVS
jgi:hypothetical protein